MSTGARDTRVTDYCCHLTKCADAACSYRMVAREVREQVALAIEAAADEHNRNIAAMAGLPYDPDRPDGMVASGIRRAARVARGQS